MWRAAVPPRRWRRRRGIVRHSGPNEYIMLDDIASFMKSIASFPFRFGVIRA
jgi:hypothetical protein